MIARVSVIVPVFNGEKYIAEALESVLSQTYPDVECIVVDDGSTDRTADIVRGFGERVRYLYQENAERSAARNAGIALASGDFLSFLDADDLLAPCKLAEQIAFLEASPGYDAVYSRVTYFQDTGNRNFFTVRRITPSGDITLPLLLGNFITMNSPLIRRAAVERVSGFDPSLTRYEDWDFLLRLALTGSRFGFLDSCHALCRMHGENTVRDGLLMFEAKLSVACKTVLQFGDELRRRGIEGRGIAAFHQADYGRKLILGGRVEEGRGLIAEACRVPFRHRMKFRIFALAARLLGRRLLTGVQKHADRMLKYRRANAP